VLKACRCPDVDAVWGVVELMRKEAPAMDHISVCICTYRRPHLLKRLLYELIHQCIDERFSFSVVVADNDSAESARGVVTEFASTATIPVKYCVEPDQNIALARNRAIAHAVGNYIAFIDDDEYPCQTWLQGLYDTCSACGADGVLGPVFSYFEEPPPKWLVEGGFFERQTHATGYKIGFHDMRTSNVIIKTKIIDTAQPPFRPEFGSGGEDADFFRRMVNKGYLFVWCNESVVYELIPPVRFRCRYLLRRALHRGNVSFRLKEGRTIAILKAFLAVPAYSLALPCLFLVGRISFIKYLVKLCDHAGLLLGLFRITPFDKYK
jgi:succinoglycan biosynthesis protein ExoM